jgi:hypothetical protein
MRADGRTLEHVPFLRNRNMLSIVSFAHVLVGEPASTSPEHAPVDPAGSRHTVRRRAIARRATAVRRAARADGAAPATAIDAGRAPAAPTQAPGPGARSACTDARSLAAARRCGLGQEESRCGLGGNDTRGARVTVDAAIGGVGWSRSRPCGIATCSRFMHVLVGEPEALDQSSHKAMTRPATNEIVLTCCVSIPNNG